MDKSLAKIIVNNNQNEFKTENYDSFENHIDGRCK